MKSQHMEEDTWKAIYLKKRISKIFMDFLQLNSGGKKQT